MLVYGSSPYSSSVFEAHEPSSSALDKFAYASENSSHLTMDKNYFMQSCDMLEGALFKATDKSNKDIFVFPPRERVSQNTNLSGNVLSMIYIGVDNTCMISRIST